MKKARLVLTASLLTVGSFAALTFTSCSKDDVTCNLGYEGKDCKTEVRNSYKNTYRGSGSDNTGDTYTNWALRFSTIGTDATKMRLELLDNNNANKLAFNVTLTTNTTYSVDPTTNGNSSYTGSGALSTTNSSLTLTEKLDESGTVTTTIFTFANMIKE